MKLSVITFDITCRVRIKYKGVFLVYFYLKIKIMLFFSKGKDRYSTLSQNNNNEQEKAEKMVFTSEVFF